jgi:hypothetical protein
MRRFHHVTSLRVSHAGEEDCHWPARHEGMKTHMILIVALALLMLALGGWAVRGTRRLAGG